MAENGFLYKTLIDPVLHGLRKQVIREIDEQTSVIDIASGTGALAFLLADKCRQVVGIDNSESMIRTAEKTKQKLNIKNVHFTLADATDLSAFMHKEFDYATMSLALHQFPSALRSKIIDEIRRIASKLVIMDFAVPLPQNILGSGARFIERLAGKEHYANFKDFYKNGGVQSAFSHDHFEILSTGTYGSGVFRISKYRL